MIQHGSYTTVDPIMLLTINFGGMDQVLTINCADAKGVERRKYMIHKDKTLERTNW